MEIRINLSNIINKLNIYKHLKNKIIKDDLKIIELWNNYLDNIIKYSDNSCYLLRTSLQVKYSLNKFKIIHTQSGLKLCEISYFKKNIKVFPKNILSLIFSQYNIHIDWKNKILKRFSNNIEYVIGKPKYIYYNITTNSFAFIFDNIDISKEFSIKVKNCGEILKYFIDELKYLLI